ncbi:hypothetical protein H5410_034995, partial [Solanum commersonii]
MNRWDPKLTFSPWKLIWKVKIPYKVVVLPVGGERGCTYTRESYEKGNTNVPKMLFFGGHRGNCLLASRYKLDSGEAGTSSRKWNMKGRGKTDKSRWKIVLP